MAEKRFVYIEHKGADYILDSPNWDLDYIEMLGDTLEAKEIVDLLNEQDAIIQHLKTVIRRYETSNDIKSRSNNNLHLDNLKLEKENEQLKQQLNEYMQQRDDIYTTSKHPMRFV